MRKERYEVLFEKITSDVQLVLEGHSMLDRKIEALRHDVGMMKDELGHVEQAVTESTKSLGALIGRFDAHERNHFR